MKVKSIIPSILYKDATTAIDWLCNAFGFEKHLIVPGENGIIVHAQLILGEIMIMIGSSQQQSDYSKLIKQPNEVGNFETQSPYIVLEEIDIEAHYEKAKKQGAKIVIEFKSEAYGGKNYTCYDIEGHLWNFGSYDPWNKKINKVFSTLKNYENHIFINRITPNIFSVDMEGSK